MGFRSRIRTVLTAGSLLSLLALGGCTVNPVTGASELLFVSPAQELSIGQQQYAPSQQSQGGQYMVNPELSVYVSQVGKKVAAVSGRPDLPYEFVVLNNDVPNAWALPGGKIAINRGLLVHLDDEAQLAAVLAHEVVHAAAGHSAQQMTQGMLLGVGGQIVGIIGSQAGYGELIGTGSQLGSALIQSRYSRDKELEADRYGMTYMSRVGYEPEAAVELQEKFVQLSQGQQSSWMEGLFASHPPSTARVTANRQYAAQLTPGVRNEKAYQKAIQQLKKDAQAYAYNQAALKAANQGQLDQAMGLVNQAIKAQPKESLFYTTKGQFQLQQKDYQNALNSFQQAHKLYPEYFLPLLGSGLAAKSLKSYARAEQDLILSSKLLPTQLTAFHLGEVTLAQNKNTEAVNYFKQAAQGGGEIGQASLAYLQKLGVTGQ